MREHDPKRAEMLFWQKVDKNGPLPEGKPELGNCHVWTRALNKTGYGHLRVNKKDWTAHRFAIFLATGVVPPLQVNHFCNRRTCVRLDHLQQGTQVDNMRQMHADGRYVGNTQLSAEQVSQLKALKGTMKQKEAAALFGVTQPLVSLIWSGKHRGHIT